MAFDLSASTDPQEYFRINNQITDLEPSVPRPSLDDNLEAAIFQDWANVDLSDFYPPLDGIDTQQLDNGIWPQIQDSSWQFQGSGLAEFGYSDPFENMFHFNDLSLLSELTPTTTNFAPPPPFNVSSLVPTRSSQYLSPSNVGTQEFNHSSQPSPSTRTAPYNCNHCPRKFDKKHQLTRHERVHTLPVVCPVRSCPIRSATNRDLNRHIVARHPDHALAVPCHRCPIGDCRYARDGFKRKDHLKRHVRKVHGREVA